MAYGNNNHYLIKVLTNKGIKLINKLIPGDKLYNYLSSEYLTVQEVKQTEYELIAKVTYTDDRTQLIGINDLVYIGNRYIMELDENINHVNINIEMPEFKFHEIHNPLNPDPYIAGVLLFHGDYKNRYISLPNDIVNGNNEFAYKYKVQYADVLKGRNNFFSWMYDENRITWKEFFPNYDFYAKTHRISDPPIPYEYQFASENDRKQFIRGVFDVGYNVEYFPFGNALIHEDENRLKYFQRMLWSLGVPSQIHYLPKYQLMDGVYTDAKYDRKYSLQLLRKLENYPGFYYNFDYIETMIKVNENEIISIPRFYTYGIKSIDLIGPGVLDNVVLNEKNSVYATDIFLPRVSL